MCKPLFFTCQGPVSCFSPLPAAPLLHTLLPFGGRPSKLTHDGEAHLLLPGPTPQQSAHPHSTKTAAHVGGIPCDTRMVNGRIWCTHWCTHWCRCKDTHSRISRFYKLLLQVLGPFIPYRTVFHNSKSGVSGMRGLCSRLRFAVQHQCFGTHAAQRFE